MLQKLPRVQLGGKTILVNTHLCTGCYSPIHYIFIVGSVLLAVYSFAFPTIVGKVITSMIPKAIKPDDPENPVFSPPSGEPGDPIFDKKKKLYDELHGNGNLQ